MHRPAHGRVVDAANRAPAVQRAPHRALVRGEGRARALHVERAEVRGARRRGRGHPAHEVRELEVEVRRAVGDGVVLRPR